jgi:hypothetical protein
MSRNIVSIVTFIISFLIVLGILQFIVHVTGAILKLGIGAIIAVIAAGIAFAVVKGTRDTTPTV